MDNEELCRTEYKPFGQKLREAFNDPVFIKDTKEMLDKAANVICRHYFEKQERERIKEELYEAYKAGKIRIEE